MFFFSNLVQVIILKVNIYIVLVRNKFIVYISTTLFQSLSQKKKIDILQQKCLLRFRVSILKQSTTISFIFKRNDSRRKTKTKIKKILGCRNFLLHIDNKPGQSKYLLARFPEKILLNLTNWNITLFLTENSISSPAAVQSPKMRPFRLVQTSSLCWCDKSQHYIACTLALVASWSPLAVL